MTDLCLNSSMQKEIIKIRFNTEKEKTDPNLPAWRVLVNGQEKLATSVEIRVPSITTMDHLPAGQVKWHISCEGFATWQDQTCIINE